MSPPSFHSTGKPDGDFYALAYVPGFYGDPSAYADTRAFHILRFSSSPGFMPFSFHTVSLDGEFRGYSKGENLLSPEFAVLDASLELRIPPHSWRLYPLASIDWSTSAADSACRLAYATARRRLANILRLARLHARFQHKYPNDQAGFKVDSESTKIEWGVFTPEDKEIRECLNESGL